MRLDEINKPWLYHATDFKRAKSILEQDMMHAATYQTIDGRGYSGVSLTRDLSFAKHFQMPATGCIFRFDRDRLRHNYKLFPFSYHKSRQHKNPEGGRIDEAEEFLVGHLKHVSRYLDAILVAHDIEQRFQNWVDSLRRPDGGLTNVDQKWIEMYKPGLETVLQHPATERIGWNWD
jgi:hypothetical protein